MSSGESRARSFSVETRDPPRYANRLNLARGGRRPQHASRFGGETLTRGGGREPCDVSRRAHLRSSIRSPRSSVSPVICGVPRRITRTRFVFGFGITATGGLVTHRLMSNQSRPEGRATPRRHAVGFASVARRIFGADLSAGLEEALRGRKGDTLCTPRAAGAVGAAGSVTGETRLTGAKLGVAGCGRWKFMRHP